MTDQTELERLKAAAWVAAHAAWEAERVARGARDAAREAAREAADAADAAWVAAQRKAATAREAGKPVVHSTAEV